MCVTCLISLIQDDLLRLGTASYLKEQGKSMLTFYYKGNSYIRRPGHRLCHDFGHSNFVSNAKNLCLSYIKQIMNVSHLYNGTNISFSES